MSFIDEIFAKAHADPRRILLPEANDDRTLHAAATLRERGLAQVILLGDEGSISARLEQLHISPGFAIADPSRAPWLDEFVAEYYALRKTKGMTEDAARQAMLDPLVHGIMMLHKGRGDGLVAGAIHSTADTLRPALQIVRTAPGVSLVSSFFFMLVGETAYLFADCGLVEEPSAEQLAEIALSTAGTALAFGIEPNVALLSYSTKGSADSASTRRVVEATRIAQSKVMERFGASSSVRIDGELQGDAALVETIGKKKAPGSTVAGKARVLVFPDLNSGNIAYKLVERLGGAKAFGPILQGLRLPANDLSRGCSAEDIVGVAAITVVQSQMAAPKHAAPESVI
ncbi:MAG: phosphate acetyltransferase [Candidatus Hydrogenedentes bacterium]|nr:phosphate acetyltransferase [Candidatus Hydrogenedentota bacterium]